MKHRCTKSGEFKLGFQLNMQIIADGLEDRFKEVSFYSEEDSCRLDGVKILAGDRGLKSNYVYMMYGHDVKEAFSTYEGIAFVVVGKADVSFFPENSPIVQVSDSCGFLEVLDVIQDTFEKYKKWDWDLQRALTSEKPLDEILMASMEIFQNPMFIHDTNFFILSSPRYVPGMLIWDTDPRTGCRMVPMSTINDFKVDLEYLEGLSKKEPMIFSAEQRGYRILYTNLWCFGRYEGRILVDELQSLIRPGHLYAMEYLGKFIEQCMQKKELCWLGIGNEMEQFFSDLLSKKIQDKQQAMNYLQLLSWNLDDHYLCLQVITEQKDFRLVSSSVTLGQINAQISAGHAFLYEGSIVAIVNLTYGETTPQKTCSELAIILREGLLKMGVSSVVKDFMLLPEAYEQAHIALDFGRASDSMYWYYYFQDYMLDYMIDCASKEVPLQLLCSAALHELKKYDAKNNTELYHTLQVFLRRERNVLQTSKELFIHRSTLAYRLERIQKITGINLDDPKERLSLLISYYMLEENGAKI